jgi:hypothetical protein
VFIEAATAAIRAVDPTAIISVNGMGQDDSGAACGNLGYLGINWGDGFITNRNQLSARQLSDPSFLFQ